MFKWFAPLLLLAGKPDLLLRLVAAVIAGAILFFGVWLLSNIALTFDALKNPYIAAGLRLVSSLFLYRGGDGWLAAAASAVAAGEAPAARTGAGNTACRTRS